MPSQARARALAELKAEIARTRAVRDRWAARAEAAKGIGRTARWALGMVDLAEQRLAQLERSMQVLMQGEEDAPDDESRDP